MTPDGKVLHSKGTTVTETVAQLPVETFALLAKWLGDPQFLLSMQQGFTCPAVTDAGITFRFSAQGIETKQEIAGCVLGDAKSVPSDIAQALAGL